ncbi:MULTISPECIES: acyl-CoA dehydrogenase family protein [unclassified Streptomyces]|uniref:acyl-CoA dehydrogenase family protein n=1 Tax=unclassified Streptomyces TaxID=2593676 RepID=UPI00278C6611|nr:MULTISPECIES: acyl-CoA dehydrogenase family protein [unclassified Streptomyces]
MTTTAPTHPPLSPADEAAERAALVARAAELRPLVRRHSARTEADRRVPQEVIDALAEAGLFKTAVPRRYGGHEAGVKTMLDVSAQVAEGDGSTAWVVTLINICAWMTGLFPQRAQDDVFGADPNARVSGVLAPTSTTRKVDGGWRVTGRWYYNSGSLHADWAVLGVPLTDESGEAVDHSLVLIPVPEMTVEDTWFVAGMKGSGSNCLVAEDVFVPEHRVVSVPAAIEGDYPTERGDEEPLYRSAFVPILSLVLAGPQLGLGRAALEIVRGKAGRKPISYTFFDTQSESVTFQNQIAQAAMMIDTAQLHAYRAAEDIERAADRGEYPDTLTRARVRADTACAIEHVTKAIDVLLYAHGAGSFADVNPLQRIWRDSAVAARHAVTLPAVSYEVYGKALLNLDEKITPLV